MAIRYLKEGRKCLSIARILAIVALCYPGSIAYAEMSDTAKGGIGGGLIGALAGSLGGYAGAGALIGGGVGLLGGAISDSSKEKAKDGQQKQLEDAYQKGVKDGSNVHYTEGSDRKHIDSFGDNLKN